jgi:hypothetical protein
VVVAVKNAVREIVSPTTYESLDQASAELAKITAAQRSGDEWPDVPWLSVKGGDVSAAFVRASERRGGPRADIESLMQRMRDALGLKPADTDKPRPDAAPEPPASSLLAEEGTSYESPSAAPA